MRLPLYLRGGNPAFYDFKLDLMLLAGFDDTLLLSEGFCDLTLVLLDAVSDIGSNLRFALCTR